MKTWHFLQVSSRIIGKNRHRSERFTGTATSDSVNGIGTKSGPTAEMTRLVASNILSGEDLYVPLGNNHQQQ